MDCWHCNTELILGGNHDLEDDESEEFSMVTNLSCSGCGSLVEVYFPKKVTRRVVAVMLEPGLNELFGTDYEPYKEDSNG
jgi:RNase P subunit RPR2|tara:strand:- start:620 stop:859 length:240 start_codon:yes stop_codon:yes gene_type:complete